MSLPTPESLRATCRRIFLRGLRLSSRIGAYDHERTAPQTILIDCDLWVRLDAATSGRDALEDVFNYDEAVAVLREEAARGHTDLQETLLDRMLERLCTLPGVELVRLATAKPEAYPDAQAVGIETWRAPPLERHSKTMSNMTENTIPIFSTPTGETPPSERNRKSVSQKKLEKRVVRLTGQAVTDFDMISEGDKVMVAMSGGKDSYVLLDTLKTLQARAPIHFDLLAVNVHQHIPEFPLEELRGFLESSGVPYHIEDQDTNSLIQKLIPEGRNVCSLCARLRRGILYRVAREHGCNKIALGHHMDDIVSTLLLNLFYGGRLKAMPPVLLNDRKDCVVIRPLAYVRESETEKLARIRGYPLAAKGICGAGENLKRQEIKALMKSWDREFPGRIYNIFMSLTRVSPSHLLDQTLYDFRGFKPLLPAADAPAEGD